MFHRDLLQVSKGIVAAALAFVAVPLVLIYEVGVPWAPYAHSVLSSSAFAVADAIAWTSWLACSMALLISVWHRVDARDASAALAPLSVDGVAAYIAAAIILLLTLTPLTYSPLGAGTPAAAASAALPTKGDPDKVTPPNRVSSRDSFATIAQHYLVESHVGTTDLAVSDFGRLMSDSPLFMDPTKLRPGSNRILRATRHAAHNDPRSTVTPPSTFTAISDPPQRTNFPELTALGLGAITAAALARRSRRRARSGHAGPANTHSMSLSEEAIDVSTLTAGFGHNLQLTQIEATNRLLAMAAANIDADIVPRMSFMRLNSDGVEIIFSCPTIIVWLF